MFKKCATNSNYKVFPHFMFQCPSWSLSSYRLDLSMPIFGFHKRASHFSMLKLLCWLDDAGFQYLVYILTTSLVYSFYYSSLAVFLFGSEIFSSIVLLCFIYQCALFVYFVFLAPDCSVLHQPIGSVLST